MRKQIGLWLRRHAASGADKVFLEPLGYIGFFSQLKILDVPGLCAPEVVAAEKKLQTTSFAKIIPEVQPDWLVLRPVEANEVYRATPYLLTEAYSAVKVFDASDRVASYHWLPGRGFLRHDERFIVFNHNRIRAEAHTLPGTALDKLGQTDEAIRHYQQAISLKPDDAKAHNDLGVALADKGQADEAVPQYQEAIRLKPDHADAHNNFGLVLGRKGQIEEAIRQFQEAVRWKPDSAEPHNNLGIVFYQQSRIDEAVRQFQEALRLKPDLADARRNLEIVIGRKTNSWQPSGASTGR
jgi:tetratricopeptide (TPR) repeat protein